MGRKTIQGDPPPGSAASDHLGRANRTGVSVPLTCAQAEAPTKHPALDTLRTLEPERLTPLDALQLLIKLKGLVK